MKDDEVALFCADVAFVSLGMSCQGAIQLEVQRPLIGALLGSEAVIKRTPFDWLICPPTSAANMIAEDRYYPQDSSELECVPGLPPRWPAVGDCYFWHESTNVAASPEQFFAKFVHLSHTFKSVAKCAHPIFFVANTQDNLADEVQAVASIQYQFTDEAIGQLASSVSERFDSPLYVVSAPERHALSTPGNLERLFLMDIYPGIRGSDSDWAAVFRGMLERTLSES